MIERVFIQCSWSYPCPSTAIHASHPSAAKILFSVPPLGDGLGRGQRRRRVQSSPKSLSNQFENHPSVFRNRLQPRKPPHLRKINSPETQTRKQNVDPVPQRLVVHRFHSPRDG